MIPFATFALVSYCPSSSIQGWKCGDACNALPGFNPILVGGNGNDIQNYFVGHWPQGKTIVIGHEGTDPTKLESDLTDAEVVTGALNTTLFPSASSSVQVHDGFRDEHALTADVIYGAVTSLIHSTGVADVTCVGHSLGGALSLLECASIKDRLGSSVTVHARTFGTPRVGNSNWVAYFDPLVSDIQRVNNEQDLIPTVPGRFLGFAHPKGEIHILSANNAVSCTGDDDGTDSQCTDSSVPTILQGSILNHLGPYQGVNIGTIYCK